VDSTEFEHTVRRYRDRVYGFAVHFLGDRREAEDVTQEVFIRLWNHHHNLDGVSAQAWLFRVARNSCIDVYRHTRLQRSVVSDDEAGMERVAADSQSPDQWTEQQIVEEHLQTALDSLSEPQRSIVILREIQGLKYDEICQALQLPMATVKVYLHRGRRTLRKQLSEIYAAQLT